MVVFVFGRVVKAVGLGLSKNSLQITTLPLTSIGSFFYLFESQFSHLQNGCGKAYLMG